MILKVSFQFKSSFCYRVMGSMATHQLTEGAEGARSTMGKRNWEMHESHKFWLGYDVTSVRPSVRTSAPPCKPM